MSGYVTIAGILYRWLLTAQGVLVVGQHAFATARVDRRRWVVSRQRWGRLETYTIELPIPDPPAPVMPRIARRVRASLKGAVL